MNNKIDLVFKTVNDIALGNEFRFKGDQIVLLERYFLHRALGLTSHKIAKLTSCDKIKVYDSIKRVNEGERFADVKRKILDEMKYLNLC